MDAQARVEFRALVVNHTIVAAGQLPEAYRRALDAGEKPFETTSVSSFQLPVETNAAARMFPRQETLRGLREDLLFLGSHLEESLAEELLQPGEGDVLHGEVPAVLKKEAEGDSRIRVCVRHEEVSEGLRGDDHGGDRTRLSS